MVRRIRSGEGGLLRQVRLRALRTDPDAFGSSYERETALTDDEWEERVESSATGNEQLIVVGDGDDGFVAMAGAFTRPEVPRVRHLYGMWVAPEVRGSGFGGRLVGEIVMWSRDAGAAEVRLWVVESNLIAVRLYEKAGFSPTGETQPLPSNPDLVEQRMRLSLA